MRRIQRLRDQKGCHCPQVPGIVTAPPAPRLIPKSPLGVSVWTRVLLDKYLYGRPTHRFCEEWRHHGFPSNSRRAIKPSNYRALLGIFS